MRIVIIANQREHLCPQRTMIGMSTPTKRDGGLAELVSVPEQNIFEVPKGLNMKEAALAEPTAVALHAVLLAETNLKKPLSECKIFNSRCRGNRFTLWFGIK